MIEDAAQAIGTKYKNGVHAGSIGDIGCFSFFPSKNLGAFGDAGLCTTNDAELAERMRVLRVHGGKPKYFHALIGGNFRIDELQAAVLRVKLKYLDGWTAGAPAQRRVLRPGVRRGGLGEQACARRARWPAAGTSSISTWSGWRTAMRCGRRLTERGIGTEIYYPVPLHLQQCFAYLGYGAGDFPHSERAAARNPGAADLPGTRPRSSWRTWLRASPSSTADRRAARCAARPAAALQVFLKSSGSSWCRDSSL